MTSGSCSLGKTRYLCILVLVCFTSLIQAQEISKFDLEERAEHFFQQERYEKALADYEVLHNMYPKDAQYAYLLGRCYLHSNRYLDKACELLKFAATRNFGDDAYFYLGQAYHLTYNFEDAMLSFITFQKTASNRALKKYDVEYYISVTSNAKQAVEMAQNIQVEDMHVIPDHAMEGAFTGLSRGKYIYTPDEFRSAADQESDYTSLMYLPDNIEIGDFVFFSSKGKNGRNESQICYAQRVSKHDYSLPEPLPDVINTAYDEAYPYYDKENNILYFSSKGHNTSGGYDIFKSVYNEKDKSWSMPDKLAFPINSVHDDIMYTLNDDKNQVSFVTNRNSGPGEYEAYTLMLLNKGDYFRPSDKDEIRNLAMLAPSGITEDAPLLATAEEQPAEEISILPEYNSPELSGEDASYASLIEEALDLQAQSDSLASVVRGLRLKAEETDNYQQKQELIASISTLDRETKRLQQRADGKFEEADLLRRGVNEPELAEVNNTLVRENTSSGITGYTFSTPATSDPKPAKKKKEENREDYNQGYEAAQSMGKEIASSFNIMNSSPYSNNNPIPIASLPSGLVYRIQLGAFTKDIPENTFGGLMPLSKEKYATATKYYVGVFGSITEAREALEKVKAYGYPDAFLVSFYDQDKISVQKAREIEFSDR